MAIIYIIVYSVAFLCVISIGLAVIFGLMKVINVAHGEFMMIGAYGCIFGYGLGLNFILACILGGLLTAVFGVIVERLVISRLYGRMVDTLLVTWGLSLLLVGSATALMGPQARSLPVEFGTVEIAGERVSSFSLYIIALAIILVALTWVLASFTRWGLIVRGTMQRPEVANGLGVNLNAVYAATFGYGAFLTGVAGAALVPLVGASPTLGILYVSKAFATVIVGGHLPVIGTASVASMFGLVDGLASFFYSSVAGEIVVFLIAIVILRFLPQGVTGRMQRGI